MEGYNSSKDSFSTSHIGPDREFSGYESSDHKIKWESFSASHIGPDRIWNMGYLESGDEHNDESKVQIV